MVAETTQMSEPASSEEQRKRLDYLIDEASMLSFPASDPPAVFVEEPDPTRKKNVTDAGVPPREARRR
jgi:hypothetical protein